MKMYARLRLYVVGQDEYSLIISSCRIYLLFLPSYKKCLTQYIYTPTNFSLQIISVRRRKINAVYFEEVGTKQNI